MSAAKKVNNEDAMKGVHQLSDVENDVSTEVVIHAQMVYLNSVQFNPRNGSP